MISLEDARSHLPSLNRGAYFNTGYCGPLPVSAAEAMKREVDRDLANPRGRADAADVEEAMVAAAKSAFASVLAGVSGEDLVLTDSTTHGLGTVFAGLGLSSGDEIVTSDEEHIGLGALLGAAELRGVRVVVAPFADPDAIAAAVGPQTRLVTLSHLSYVSGRNCSPEAIASRVDVPVVLDCAHTPGSLVFDPAASGAAAVAFPGQKWCLGPEGIGGLWIAPSWLERIAPSVVSFRSMDWWLSPDEYEMRSGPARYDGGTVSRPVLAGLTESIRWLRDDVGLDWAISQTQVQADRARVLLAEVPGVQVLSPVGSPGGLVGLRIEGSSTIADYDAEAARLWDAGVFLRRIENPPGLRASVAWFNTDEEIELLVSALADGVAARS